MPPIPSDERKRQRTFYNLKLAKSSTSTRCSLFTKNGSNTTGCDVGNPLCTKCQTKKVPRESRKTMEEREKETSEEKFSVVLFLFLLKFPIVLFAIHERQSHSLSLSVSLCQMGTRGATKLRRTKREGRRRSRESSRRNALVRISFPSARAAERAVELCLTNA